MAKQLVGPIERHVDKAVLGLAGLVLIGVIAKYLVSTPNQIEMRGVMAKPDNIDEIVSSKADEVRDRIRGAPLPEQEPFEPRSGEFASALDAFRAAGLSDTLPAAVPVGPETPLVGPPKVVEGYIKLVEVVRLPKPIVQVGRSTLELLPDADVYYDESMSAAYYTPVNWAIVSSVFDIQEQRRRQAREYLEREEVYVGAVEVQRRAMREDGTWSEDDWTYVVPLSAEDPPPAEPEIRLREEDGNWVAAADDYYKLEEYFDRLSFGDQQLEILRPLLPLVINGTPWTVPVITSRRDVLMQDDELRFPGEPPAREPEDQRYPDAFYFVESDDGEEAELTGQEWVRQKFKQAEAKLTEARELLSENTANEARNIFVDIVASPYSTAADKEKAQRWIDRADQVIRDIRRDIIDRQRRGPTLPGSGSAAEGESPPVRTLLPIQQLWVHDAQPDSLKGGQTYQYRIRPWIYNRYAGLPGKLEKPEDASRVLITGEWSEPSDPVYVEPERRFFATNVTTDREDKVGVEIYRWFEGVTVRASSYFKVGEAITYAERVPVPLPEDPETFDRPIVEFTANATVLDIEANRSYRERKKTAGKGVYFQPGRSGKTVAFVDAEGHVFERVISVDKAHPDKKALKSRVWQPPKVEAASEVPGGKGPGKDKRKTGRDPDGP
jgi:hypothetical protein